MANDVRTEVTAERQYRVSINNTHTHTRLLKYGSIYDGFKTKEYKKIKIQKNNTN